MTNQQIIFIINRSTNMQVDKKQGKNKYIYVTQEEEANENGGLVCTACRSWQQKTQELIWGYEQLLSVKERELQTMAQMVNQLDDKLKRAESKVENFTRKVQGYEQQIEKIKGHCSNQNVINYYKERETELLTQMKNIQNELFNKNVQIKDQIDCKEDRVLTNILTQPKLTINKQTPTSRSQESIIQTSQSLGKMLQRNLCDLEKMTQQKMMLQVKHRMALLRAAELSVLK